MDYNQAKFEDFGQLRPYKFNLVANWAALNRRIAREAIDAIKAAHLANRQVLMLLPIGPIDYSYWTILCNEEKVSCEPLIALFMVEYLDDRNHYIATNHPLSFRHYVQKTLVNRLEPKLRPDPANIKFPDPHQPAAATALIESRGGADICFSGMGITGHLAFNDPPEPGEPLDDAEVRGSRTRGVTLSRESITQIAMGGVHGNWDVLPHRAVTLGLHEILMSRKIHLTLMRSWHSGVMRRALFGPVSGRCPASFVQQHKDVEVTVTALAARVPVCNLTQATGEGEDT